MQCPSRLVTLNVSCTQMVTDRRWWLCGQWVQRHQSRANEGDSQSGWTSEKESDLPAFTWICDRTWMSTLVLGVGKCRTEVSLWVVQLLAISSATANLYLKLPVRAALRGQPCRWWPMLRQREKEVWCLLIHVLDNQSGISLARTNDNLCYTALDHYQLLLPYSSWLTGTKITWTSPHVNGWSGAYLDIYMGVPSHWWVYRVHNRSPK